MFESQVVSYENDNSHLQYSAECHETILLKINFDEIALKMLCMQPNVHGSFKKSTLANQ